MRKGVLGLMVILALFVAGCGAEEYMDDDQGDDMVDSSGAGASERVDSVETVAEEVVEETGPVAVAGGDVAVERNMMDPDTLTVSKGATITFVAVDGPHLISVNGMKISGRMSAGERVDYTFEEAGEFKVFDAILKGTLVVTVAE